LVGCCTRRPVFCVAPGFGVRSGTRTVRRPSVMPHPSGCTCRPGVLDVETLRRSMLGRPAVLARLVPAAPDVGATRRPAVWALWPVTRRAPLCTVLGALRREAVPTYRL
jgi:hypothetical protein